MLPQWHLVTAETSSRKHYDSIHVCGREKLLELGTHSSYFQKQKKTGLGTESSKRTRQLMVLHYASQILILKIGMCLVGWYKRP